MESETQDFLERIIDQSKTTSRTDIRPQLDQIDQEIRRVKDQIRDRVSSNWDEFKNQFEIGTRLYNQSIDHELTFKNLNLELDHPETGLIPSLLRKFESHQTIYDQYHQSDQILKANKSLLAAYQSVCELSQLIESGHLVDASQKLNSFKSIVHQELPLNSQSRLVQRAFKKIIELEEDLKQKLIESIRDCIVLREDLNQLSETGLEIRSEIHLKANSLSGTTLRSSYAIEALQNFSEVKCQEEQIDRIVKKLTDRLTHPLIQSAAPNSKIRLSLVQSPESEESKCNLQMYQIYDEDNYLGLFDSLRLLLSTLGRMVFTSSPLKEIFSKSLITKLQTQIIEGFLDPSLPQTTKDEKSLTLIPELLSKTLEFAGWLREDGWFDGLSSDDSNMLLDWRDNIRDRFVCKVASRILEMARKAMLTTSWEGVVVPWEIIVEIQETKPPPLPSLPPSQEISSFSSDQDLVGGNVSKPLQKSNSEDKSSRFSTNLVRQFTDPLKKNISTKDSIGFKSLFNFGSESTHQRQDSQKSTTFLDRDQSSSPKSDQQPKGFRSLFDFGTSDQPTDSLNSESNTAQLNNDSSAPQTEKTSSPEMVEPPSDISSPQSSKSKNNKSDQSSKNYDNSTAQNRVEEDVDWDMGCGSSTENFLDKKLQDLKSDSLKTQDEVEEDCWGLDEAEEEEGKEDMTAIGPNPPETDITIETENKINATNHVNSSISPERIPPSLDSKKTGLQQKIKEEEFDDKEFEPDPESWGFEDEGLGTDENEGGIERKSEEDQEVMRLRGGVQSNTPSEVEEDDDEAWGWNDELSSSEKQSLTLPPKIDETQIPVQTFNEENKFTKGKGQSSFKNIVRIEDRFTISKLAQLVVNLVKDIIEDAKVISDPNFSSNCLTDSYRGLMRIVIDLGDLFRVVMPIAHSNLLDSVPSLSFQFANDCDWLSKEFIGLMEREKEECQKVVKVVEDQIEILSKDLKLLATQTRQKQLVLQRNILMECLDELESYGGFFETSKEENYLRCQRTFKQMVHLLDRLSQSIKIIVIKEDYFKLVGDLIGCILIRILNEVENQDDISEKDSISLNKLLNSLKEDLSKFFFTDGDGEGEEKVYEISRYVNCWFKFNFLSELLEASMADIMWMEEEGLLIDFDKDEIIKLIKSLFSDSELRAKNIDLINSRHLDKAK
ncbi:hypothetical protein BY996DRAFT_4610711 [Phakopsora pachyrhizi]|nr:hypothetical protein BY996DRAFT_4610711 [Phakopsora pachyrhizi]